MRPTADQCATRAARHRHLADAATLDNVRSVQLIAALAWEKEGVLAGKREARVDAGLPAATREDEAPGGPGRASGPECD